jgi:hypothetical protein
MEKQVVYEISETTQLVIHGLTRQIYDLEQIISNLETDVEALIKLRDNDRIQAEYSMDLQEQKIERLTNLLITHYNDTTWFDQTVSI